MGLNWKQFEAGVLRPALADWEQTVRVTAHPEVVVRLVGETLWHESDRLQALGQYPRGGVTLDRPFGPGRGLGSMEDGIGGGSRTWTWLREDFILRSDVMQGVFARWCRGRIPGFEEFNWNLALAVLSCRLRYFADRRALPSPGSGIDGRAHYWFNIYNGSGVEERRLKYIADAKAIPWLE